MATDEAVAKKKAYRIKWYEANRERLLAEAKIRRQIDGGKTLASERIARAKRREANVELAAKWRKDNPDRYRITQVQYVYNATPEEAAILNEKRKLGCEVCKQLTKTHIDHCHTTGKIRGVLCTRCNSAIAYAKDKPEILRALAAYLEKA